jgi:hypothetical protein
MDKLLSDVINMASGTVAGLTGFNRYSDIEAVVNKAVDNIVNGQEYEDAFAAIAAAGQELK